MKKEDFKNIANAAKDKAQDAMKNYADNVQKDLSTLQIDREKIVNSIKATESLFARGDIPANAPPDLKDRFNRLIFDKDGKRLTGKLLLSDLVSNDGMYANKTLSPVRPLQMSFHRLVLMLSLPFLYVSAFVGPWLFFLAQLLIKLTVDRYVFNKAFNIRFPEQLSGWLALSLKVGGVVVAYYILKSMPPYLYVSIVPIAYVLVVALGTQSSREAEKAPREQKLNRQDFHFTRTSLATSIDDYDNHVEARKQQVERALNDKSPVIDLNFTPLGYFATLGDMKAPDKGNKMVMSLNDLATNLIVVGEIGTGKTSGVLRPLFHSLAGLGKDEVGVLHLDNKGTLQIESAAEYPDYMLISPESVELPDGRLIRALPFNPIEGLNGEEAATSIAECFAGADEEDDIWAGAARDLLTNCAVILEFARRFNPTRDDNKWCLYNLLKAPTDEQYMLSLLKQIPENEWNKNPYLYHAAVYYTGTFRKLANETKSSVVFNVRTWASKITCNRYISPWLTVEYGVKVEQVCEGRKVGVFTPHFRYGDAGKTVERLTRYRVYKSIKNRGDKWKDDEAMALRGLNPQKQVFLLWDEFALGVGAGKMESDLMPIGRSLGISVIGAIQTKTELDARIGRERSDALFANFLSFLVYRTDKNTLDYFSERVGYIAKVKPAGHGDVPVGIDYYGSVKAHSQSAIKDKSTRSDVIFNQQKMEDKSYSESTSTNFGSTSTTKNTSYKTDPNFRDSLFIDGSLITLKNDKLFDFEESGRFLQAPFTALCQIHRGGVVRRDIVRTHPVFMNNILQK